MHVLIIGGSGRTGKLVIDEALRRGHEVTALVRNLSSLEARKGLHTVQGTPSKRSDVEAAFTRDMATPIAAVIVTLNAPRKSDSPFATPVAPPRFMADAHVNLVAVMKDHGTRKIVTMSSVGVGDSFAESAFLFRFMLRHTNMSAQFADHDLVDEEMKASGMDYVLVRPTRLAEGKVAPIKEYGNLGKGAGMMSSITRTSVAGFLVDAAERGNWNRSTPVISN